MFKKKPFFIVFEGVEGCGKSYQSKKLFKKLKQNGFNTILTREPGGTPSAELIRSLILKDYFNKNKKNYYIIDSSKNDNQLEKKILKIISKYLNIK